MSLGAYQIVKYFGNGCSDSERDEIEAWKNASVENQKLFDELKNIWEAAEKAPDAIHPEIEKAWENIKAQTAIKQRQTRNAIMKLPVRYFIRIAASVLILLGIGAVVKSVYFNKPTMKIEAALNNGKKEVLLSDGTTVFLNRNSRVSFPDKFGKVREIQLESEAYFKVAKDAHHPFIVHAGGTDVKVLGTSFNIKIKEKGEVLVSVLTGKVAFQSQNNKSKMVQLIKGDQGIFDATSERLEKSHFSDENFLSWQTGILRFNNQSLYDAAKTLAEYYGKKIEVDIELKNRQITVVFDNQPLDDALNILALTLDISIEHGADKIVLKPSHHN